MLIQISGNKYLYTERDINYTQFWEILYNHHTVYYLGIPYTDTCNQLYTLFWIVSVNIIHFCKGVVMVT